MLSVCEDREHFFESELKKRRNICVKVKNFIPHQRRKDTAKEGYKVRQAIELRLQDGWVELKRKGVDHRQFRHPTKSGKVTVRGHLNETLSQFLLNSIWKQAGWK